jgi:hypothetical protein
MAELDDVNNIKTSNALGVETLTTYYDDLLPNTAPVQGDMLVSTPWNAAYIFGATLFTDEFTDADSDSLLWIKINSLPLRGKLTILGSQAKIGQIVALSDVANMTYTPPFGLYGSLIDSFKVSVLDDGTPANLWSESATITFTLTNANAKPTATDSEIVTEFSIPYVFTVDDLTQDYADAEGNLTSWFEFTSIPPIYLGYLTLDDEQVTVADLPLFLTVSDINADRLKYVDSGDITEDKQILIDYVIHDNSQ